MTRPPRWTISRQNPDTNFTEWLGIHNDDTDKREWEDYEGRYRFRDKAEAASEARVYGGTVWKES